MAFDCKVYFIKKDEVYGQIQTEDFDFLCQLRSHFSFFVDGYKFQPSYKNGFWDGKKRLLSESGRIHLGLWPEVVKFCKSYDHPYKIDPKIKKFNLDCTKFQGFVDKLDTRDEGEKIPPYEYQVTAARKSLEWQRCILLSPTSSGKSLIQYILIRMYEKLIPKQKILMVVPTVALVSQMADDFNNYSSAIEWSAYDEIHQITAGVDRVTGKKITISTYQSLAKQPADFFNDFGAILVDEVHTATSVSVMKILESSVNASWRVGLTGTLDECKTNLMILKGLFGPMFDVISTKELMDMNRVAQLSVKVKIIKHSEEDCKNMRSAPRGEVDEKTNKPKRRKATYQEEISEIIDNEKRNDYIVNYATKLDGNSIIMVNRIEHANLLFKQITELHPDRDVFLYYGGTKKEDRDRIRKIMESKENAIIIGSIGVLSTGISVKRLHHLLLCHPSKSRIKVLQSIGRVLRKSKYGNNVFVHDFVDDYSIGAFVNYVFAHGQKRVEFYTQQQFVFDVESIKI